MRYPKYIKSIMMLASGFTASASYAQDAATAAVPAAASTAPAQSSTDYSMYLLIGLAAILLVAIAVLGQVLVRLTVYVYENKSKLVKSVLLFLMLAAGSSLFAQDATTAAAPAKAAASGGFSMDFLVAMTVIMTEAFVIFMMLMRIMSLINTINPKAQASRQIKFELPRWFDRVNESVAVEHEKDIMLDHDYDGIRELDNQLPPWWKWGFVASIIWAVCYFSYFHLFGAAPLSAGEYENEMAEAKIAKDAYMIFSENCVACHGSQGEGGVGPNLTDNYWLHGGKINDVFKSVKYGWPANGMKSWQTDFSSIQIAQVVCYVKSLKGTTPPNPKAPQGDLYNEDGAVPNAASASTAPKDTTSK
jgi:cytochrome c oxidase cbb3-type subunit 3